jgi:hypothetical protein
MGAVLAMGGFLGQGDASREQGQRAWNHGAHRDSLSMG